MPPIGVLDDELASVVLARFAGERGCGDAGPQPPAETADRTADGIVETVAAPHSHVIAVEPRREEEPGSAAALQRALRVIAFTTSLPRLMASGASAGSWRLRVTVIGW
jgi:hypothetical protein